jgi:hypothetical protein
MILGIILIIGLGWKYQWEYDDHIYYYSLINPILFVMGYNLSAQFKLGYVSKRFCATEENLKKLDNYMKRASLEELNSIGKTKYYLIKSKYSFMKMKISIESESNYTILRAPNALIKDILKKSGISEKMS